MNPFCIPFAITNMGGALLAMDLGFMGPNYSISTACATGNYCITRRAGRGQGFRACILEVILQFVGSDPGLQASRSQSVAMKCVEVRSHNKQHLRVRGALWCACCMWARVGAGPPGKQAPLRCAGCG